MSNKTFAGRMCLEPADVIIVPEVISPSGCHHIVFLGINNSGEEFYAENGSGQGVRLMTNLQFELLYNTFLGLKRYDGINASEAVKKALSMVGTAYDFKNFNSEHFANFVQDDLAGRGQVDNAQNVLVFSA